MASELFQMNSRKKTTSSVVIKSASKSVSVVITILNEERTINQLLKGLLAQTLQPKAVIIVDAGSTDKTLDKIRSFIKKKTYKKIQIHSHQSNRSQGRNFGVEQAKTQWIAFTDAGCVPERDWLKELMLAQHRERAAVVAGYYYGIARTPFEEAVVPYALVMPRRVNQATFLPATRSMLILRTTFLEIGGFDEHLEVSEDYDFAARLRQAAIPRTMAIKARVGWYPRQNLFSFFTMVVGMAHWDARANLVRPKVYLIFVRYLLFGWISLQMLTEQSFGFWSQLWVLLLISYIMWSISKNKTYTPRGWYWLPSLQIVSDLAVIGGTLTGFLRRWV
jgi:glycosyltransferase involved in cell wall biosynthesis